MIHRRAVSVSALAVALAACAGGDAPRQARADSAAAPRRVWTPAEAAALRDSIAAADRGAPPAVRPPGPAEGEDSAAWVADEARKFEARKAAMAPYEQCMAQARASVNPTLRGQMEAACRNLPSAPR